MTTIVELGAPDSGISSIPTLMAFKDGLLVFSQPGALPARALEQVIAAVRELDTAELEAEAARLSETADHQAGSPR